MSRAEPGRSQLYHRLVVYVLFLILLWTAWRLAQLPPGR